MRVRFAPSPTGSLHIGGARTALYNWLAARGAGGELVLRIEDTDRERSTSANVEQILDALRWLELDWDEGPISQHERGDRHRARLEQLLADGRAYRDPTTGAEAAAGREARGGAGYRGTPSDDPHAAVRLRVPDGGETVVHDEVRGEIRFENRLLDDPVIARADGSVLYNFAVAVDDAELGITHVIRGDDHLSNTPKQLVVLEALGFQAPRYAHLALLHGTDGRKLSKRHGAASVGELRERGYVPAAVRNYLALLGWGSADDETLLSTEALIDRFELARVKTSSAVFDEAKLRWMNGRYLREMSPDEYLRAVAAYLGREPDAQLAAACRIVQPKAQTLAEVWTLVAFLFEEPETDERAWAKTMREGVGSPLADARAAIAGAEPFDEQALEQALGEVLARHQLKPGRLLQPIRVAITGTTVSPGLYESVAALGRERTLRRLDRALRRLRDAAGEPAGRSS